MATKSDSNWLQRIALRALALLVILGAIQYAFNSGSRDQYHILKDELYRIQELNRDLVHDNERLRLQINGIENDDRYLEQVARQEFGMIRKGEMLYRFDAPDEPSFQQ